MTDLIYTRFVFIAQKNQNDMRYNNNMNKYSKIATFKYELLVSRYNPISYLDMKKQRYIVI